ncbi:MAG: hypothetical protein A3G75_11600 [Verrucomicrobia bacterium RIFCSPLOWO2_12_FULL_64_8]|nr:MAG: hypothetical protein A3G75_11600 [Verrucomicrobia bacterium RIFCSPLOWO2_12_FULL_64_8]
MPSLSAAYFAAATGLLKRAYEVNRPVLEKLGGVIGPSVATGGMIHTFGSGHSEIISREIVGRAGGLVCVSGIYDPGGGLSENVVGYGAQLVERHDRQYGLRAGETIIVISNSGKNCSPLEVALYAKQKRLTVVGLTCVEISKTAATVHPGGKKLHEIADYVLDNCGTPGDAIVEIESKPRTGRPTAGLAKAGLPADLSAKASATAESSAKAGLPAVGSAKAGPTSTIVGAALLNLLSLEVIDWLKAHGHEPPVIRSQNVPGGIEHNRELAKKYAGRLSKPLA